MAKQLIFTSKLEFADFDDNYFAKNAAEGIIYSIVKLTIGRADSGRNSAKKSFTSNVVCIKLFGLTIGKSQKSSKVDPENPKREITDNSSNNTAAKYKQHKQQV